MTRRLILSYVLLTAFVLLIVELPLALTYAGRANDRLLSDMERDARVLAGLVEERVEVGDVAAQRRIAEGYTARSGGRVVITDPDGIALVDTEGPAGTGRDFSTRPEFRAALGGAQATGIRRSSTLGRELAYVAVPISSDARLTGVVRVSFPSDAVTDQVQAMWLRLAVLSVLVLAAAASLGWLVARWVAAPIGHLERGANRLANGDLGGRAEVVHSPPEMRHLARTFNDMAARLEVLVAAQRAFVADASHQLRTPLTALRLRIESLEDIDWSTAGAAESAREDLRAVDRELQRLAELVEALLALARSESSMRFGQVDIAATATDSVARWQPFAQERGVDVVIRAVTVPATRTPLGAVEQILDNLLSNAVDVAPSGSSIDVVVAADEAEVVLGVRDRGPGMSEADRGRATDRFWRAPGAAPGGSGLGLSIVDELVRSSGGSLALLEPPDGPGLLVEVRLPIDR